METRKLLLKGSMVLAAGQAGSQSLSMLKNAIVARAVGPAEYGIASTFAVTIQLLESLSDLGAGNYLIQATGGDDQKALNTAHAITAIRAAMNSMVLLALARPVSSLFGVPDATWAFRWIALWPLLNGLSHLDLSRLQRHYQFRQCVVDELAGQGVALVVGLLLVTWYHDYSVLLWLLLLQRLTATGTSFFFAERPYRWSLDRRYAHEIWSFGWPLVINGILLYLIVNGDRFLIASAGALLSRPLYGLENLGLYSVAGTLAGLPVLVFVGIVNRPLLPLLSNARSEPSVFGRRYIVYVQLLSLCAGVLIVVSGMLGDRLLLLVYGRQYVAAAPLYWWLAAGQALRLVRVAPVTAGQALGNNGVYVIANLVRLTGVGGAALAALLGADLLWFAGASCCAELGAVVVSMLVLKHRHGQPIRGPFVAVGMVIGAIAIVGGALTGVRGMSILLRVSMVLLATISFVCCLMIVASELRREALTFVRLTLSRLNLGVLNRHTLKGSMSTSRKGLNEG